METHPNPIEQQRQAKLNLLNLDDCHDNENDHQILDTNCNWGRSLETQNFLREKLSQRYQARRKSNRQLRPISTVSKQNKQKNPVTNDKQSLKDLLKKLQSKQLKPSNPDKLRNSMIVDFQRASRDRNWPVKYHSNRSTIEQMNKDNRLVRRGMIQSIQNQQNNFISKKIQIINSKRQVFEQSLPENAMEEPQGFMIGYQFIKKKDNIVDSKLEKRLKGIFRKNTQNKENQVLGFLDFALDPYKNTDLLKNSFIMMKNDKHRNITIEKQEINKRTFQILQEINRTKSINNVKKLASQSLKLKKPQMCAYSRTLKERSIFVEDHNRSRGKILIKSHNDSVWVKLQIRK